MCALVFLQPCFAFTASHSSLRIRSNAVTQWPSSSSLATTCVALVHFCKAPFSSMHRIIICCHLLCFLSLLISDCRCFDASFDGEPFLQVRCPLVSAAQPFCQTVAILTSLSYFRSRVFVCFFSFSSQVMKEMLIQTFGVPSGHRAAKPFHDHIISFFFLDGRVWLRHYQVP